MQKTLIRGLKTTLAEGMRIRVLVVDDSVVIRRLVTHALSEDPQIEVVGSAANGLIALEKIAQLEPDVVTLDIEMPELDGLQTLERIRSLRPALHVIMFSTLTESGASATLEALARGAEDYVTKAANAGSLDRSMEALRSELIPKVKQFYHLAKPFKLNQQQVRPPVQVLPRPSHSLLRLKRILAIGVSTGGPGALATVFSAIPKSFPLPVVVVQHMPPLFTKSLAERLNSISQLQVEEAIDGAPLEPGKALIAAGNFHMQVCKSENRPVVTLNQDPPENSCRPAVDVLFRSCAEIYEGSTIGVILTGMGSDGLKGVEALRLKGAYIIAQDEPSSVVWGMPGSVVKAGLADSVVHLDSVVPEILKQI